jgi:DNA polymerase III alpha subunit
MNHLQHIDSDGSSHVSHQGVIELAYQDLLTGAMFEWQDQAALQQYQHVCETMDNWPYVPQKANLQERSWFTPVEYQQIDLHKYVLDRCKNAAQAERARLELELISASNAAHIFKHLIFLVDQWRSKNLVWGVGRGSSVSCFVLYVIGVNRINPMDYDLHYGEFFKTAGD